MGDYDASPWAAILGQPQVAPNTGAMFGLAGALGANGAPAQSSYNTPIPPSQYAHQLDPSLTQQGMNNSDFAPILGAAGRRANAATDDVWNAFAPGAGPADETSRQNIFQDLGSARPTIPAQEIARYLANGPAHVTDPEGRTGNPAFVAGTAPNGAGVPLDQGSLAALGSSMGYVQTLSRPGSPWGGTAFRPGDPAPGTSNASILLNSSENETGKPPAEVLAHELGHTINNYIGTSGAPLSGAGPAAMSQFTAMARDRALSNGVAQGGGRSLADYQYFNSPNEQFAEGIRQYLTDPNAFKSRYPDAAGFLRGVVNSNPNMSKLLMLSDASGGQKQPIG